MPTRRDFLGSLALPAIGASRAGIPAATHASIAEAASDEKFWRSVQAAFSVDRTIVNLNNGGVSPSPTSVLAAQHRYVLHSNEAPAYTMWRVLQPRREALRKRLATAWSVTADEVAITRNASESLQICQFGFDLKRGDEVLTTTQDYPRMVTTFRQRERRDGIVLRQIRIPVPCEDDDLVVRRFEEAITPRTKLILMCHVTFTTGQILPVARVVRMAREKGVPVLVDGAHAFAHIDFELTDLDCDFYAASLHKWLCAPHGTGLLYVRKERIADLWPLMAAPASKDTDIRKFEETGTHAVATYLAIHEALSLHHQIGSTRKAARLRYLRDYWAKRLLAASDKFRLNTSLQPAFSCGIANVRITGIDSGALTRWLFSRHRILTTRIKHEECDGMRVSPHVYTTTGELDRFCDAMQIAARDGLR